MDPSRSLSRRRLLASHAALATLGLLAGCVGGDSDESGGDDDSASEDRSGDSSGDDSGEGDDATGDDGSDGDDDSGEDDDSADGGSGGELDLREANVVDVAVEGEGDAYQFDVALHHDDDGEEGYANWWQVERLDGTQLGRRDLTHPHSRQPFTRSTTVEVPAEVDCVVVRGHDQTHEYGGLAAVVDLDSGETNTVDQGPERQSFDTGDCPG